MTTNEPQPPGSGNSSEKDSSLSAKLTSATSKRSKPKNSAASNSATSSPGSEAGPTPFASPAGPTTNPSGPPAVPVSRFRARESNKAMPTNDTCGPLFTNSSPSASLQRSLESRLRARMDVNGSPEYVLTWRELDMPSGVPICQLRASARPTEDKGCSGWPTPIKNDQRGPQTGPGRQGGSSLQNVAAWATPMATDSEMAGGPNNPSLTNQVTGRYANSPLAPTEKRGAFKPGIFPLAHGIPGRVGLLRGAGNAIVPQVAAQFIRAATEAISECGSVDARQPKRTA